MGGVGGGGADRSTGMTRRLSCLSVIPLVKKQQGNKGAGGMVRVTGCGMRDAGAEARRSIAADG